MEIKDILQTYRVRKGLTQEQLAEKVYVTRQAVSRWETGETSPNQETLKLLSKIYGVSINTLLGSPRKLFCQCCGMPLVTNLSVKNRTAHLTKSIVNGVTIKVNLSIRRSTS